MGLLATPTARLILGDSASVLASLAPMSVDSLVTDPPAGIGFMGREWDGSRGGRTAWIAWLAGIMRLAFTALKPGAHALVWALPRTSHWTATAIEDAGLEIRDVHHHVFGTGFPKSLDVGKAIDARAGAVRPVVGHVDGACGVFAHSGDGAPQDIQKYAARDITAPATPDAARWSGFGTALKPAVEHWILARRPLVGTVAANVLAHGTGALNINGCRIDAGEGRPARISGMGTAVAGYESPMDGGSKADGATTFGRWPAHLSLDEDAARALDAQSGISGSGGASRFFYVPKASRSERTHRGAVANDHPTVKSLALMRWLVRLISPPGGLVLDPFAGSGSTGVACADECMRFLGVERDPGYHAIALARLRLVFWDVADLEPEPTWGYQPI